MRNRIRRFLADDDGPTAVEYAVMLALIITICIGSIQILGTKTTTSFETFSNSLDAVAS